MAVIETAHEIDAPAERVFDLARDVDLHVRSMNRYGEAAVAGVTSGLLDVGDEVTWRARHFGLTLELTVRIVALERPRHFRDSLVRGPFTRFDHDHFFEQRGGTTLMRDVVAYRLPLGPVGATADRFLVERRFRRILEERGRAIAVAAATGP